MIGATLPSAQAAAEDTQFPVHGASQLPQADLPADALPASLSDNADAVVAAAADKLGSQLRRVLGGRLQQQCQQLQVNVDMLEWFKERVLGWSGMGAGNQVVLLWSPL